MQKQLLARNIFKLRGLLMLPPVLFVTVSTQWEVENNALVFGLGGITFCLGLLLRLWAQMHLHYRLRVRKVLTTTGPYAYSRNPVYLGNCLILIGLCFLCEMFWFAPVMLLWCLVVYHLPVAHEEARLLTKYGQTYQDYMTHVPRWVPRKPAEQPKLPAKSTRAFLVPSIVAEIHSLLLLVLPIVKEALVRRC